MTTAGVIAARCADRWWAWAATQVAPASAPGRAVPGTAVPPTTATVHNEYTGSAHAVIQARDVHGDVHVHGGKRPVPDDSAWLRSCWASLAGATMEIRYLTRPDSGLDAFLVLRAEGTHQDQAERRVTALREQLGALPGHVTATPVTDQARTREVLEPFQPHHEGIVEVRKRLTVQRTSRDDTYHPWLTAVTPLTNQQPWDPLRAELARLPHHAMVSVGLAPFPIGDGPCPSRRRGRRSRPARPAGAVTDRGVARAAPAGRVRRRGARAGLGRRAAVPGPGVPRPRVRRGRPTGARCPRRAGRRHAISARTDHHGFVGAAPVVVRPTSLDLPVAWHNITALNFAPLSAYDQGSPAGAVDELARVLSSIVDLDEAEAAFRLPYRSPGRPGFFAAAPR